MTLGGFLCKKRVPDPDDSFWLNVIFSEVRRSGLCLGLLEILISYNVTCLFLIDIPALLFYCLVTCILKVRCRFRDKSVIFDKSTGVGAFVVY